MVKVAPTPDDPRSKDDPVPDRTVDMAPDPDTRLPVKIGPYTIKREIASGGMGTVYEALQENPRRPAAERNATTEALYR